MGVLPRVVRKKVLKTGGGLNAALKIIFAVCVAYIICRPFLSSPRHRTVSNDYIANPSNATGWRFEPIHATKLTGFLNALQAESEHETVHVAPAVSLGERVPDCGLSVQCPQNAFSIHVFTGKDHHDEPRLILGNGLNGGGRGINVAVVDNVTRFVQRVGHFDTYEEDSSQLETVLLNLRVGDILILLTFDEPTRKLSQVARLLLHELGSAMAQNLQYRSSWYLITQKGISGFSPYEDLHFVEARGWPVPHDVRMCIPFHITGLTIHPDPQPRENLSRRKFCEKYRYFTGFCSSDSVDNPLVANPAVRFANSKVLSAPVLVLGGDDVKHFPLTLETLIMQPGIKPCNVLVFYMPENPEIKELADLFSFAAQQYDSANLGRYCDQMNEAFDTAERLFPDAMYFVVIENGVLLAPDFLMYLAPLLDLLDADSTISSISAWSDNGFEGVSGDGRKVYRVETLSGFGFVTRRGFPVQDWCEQRFDHSATDGSPSGGDTLSPDTSRVLRIPTSDTDNGVPSDVLQALMARKRVTEMELDVVLDAANLERSRYERHLEDVLKSSVAWEISAHTLRTCLLAKEPSSFFVASSEDDAAIEQSARSVYFDQRSENDYTALKSLCRCFGLYYHPRYPPRGLYRGMLRFFWKKRDVFLIGKNSPYYKFKPEGLVPVPVEGHE